MKLMKRFLMWAGIAVAIPFGLLLLVAILLYIPPVQDFAVRKATAYASEVTGLDIRIGRLRLQPIADLRLQDFMVLDTDGDTVVAARQAVVDLAFTRILNSSINVEELSLHGVALDTKDMIAVAGIRGRLDLLTLKDDVGLADQKVNMDHLLARGLNIDIEMRDTTVVDTTESAPLEWVIGLAEAHIEDARIRFAMPGDSAMVGVSFIRLARHVCRQSVLRCGWQAMPCGTLYPCAQTRCYSRPRTSLSTAKGPTWHCRRWRSRCPAPR